MRLRSALTVKLKARPPAAGGHRKALRTGHGVGVGGVQWGMVEGNEVRNARGARLPHELDDAWMCKPPA